MPLDAIDLLVIENVGNLVCPAEFTVGENHRIVITAVTGGDNKPLKYPLMFRACGLVIVNKIDLLPHSMWTCRSCSPTSTRYIPAFGRARRRRLRGGDAGPMRVTREGVPAVNSMLATVDPFIGRLARRDEGVRDAVQRAIDRPFGGAMRDNARGRAMVDPDVPSHGSAISEGHTPGHYERQPRHLPDRSTSERLTRIEPKARDRSDSTMSRLSPP
jgi:hypothetical protein